MPNKIMISDVTLDDVYQDYLDGILTEGEYHAWLNDFARILTGMD